MRRSVAGTWLMVLSALVAVPGSAQECRRGGAPGAVVRGVVVDSATRVPLQQATVRLTWWDQGGTERKFETEADSAGRFRMCRLPVGPQLTLRGEYTGEGPARRVSVRAGDSLEVELTATARPSELRGRVVRAEDGEPLANTEVQVLDTPLRTVTSESGAFEFPRIPPGVYRVRIEQLGYALRTDTVEVGYRSEVRLEAALAPAPLPMPALTVSVRSHVLEETGFYRRREHGSGTFLTRQQWEPRLPQKPSDVLRTIAGIHVQPARSGFDNVVLDRRGCAVRYFVDGIRTNPTFQLDELNVGWIEALEIYRGPAEVPAQFTSFSSSERATCGVIVVWTRSR